MVLGMQNHQFEIHVFNGGNMELFKTLGRLREFSKAIMSVRLSRFSWLYNTVLTVFSPLLEVFCFFSTVNYKLMVFDKLSFCC